MLELHAQSQARRILASLGVSFCAANNNSIRIFPVGFVKCESDAIYMR